MSNFSNVLQKRAHKKPAFHTAKLLLILIVAVLSISAFAANAKGKVDGDLSVMVLGSGGPVATPAGRASAGYLIFTDGKPSILMDIGGGGFQRLAKSGVNVKDLDIILLSHLHIDHTGDLSSVLKTVYFHNVGAGVTRDAPFHIYGPVANGAPFPGTGIPQYPSSTDYVDAHYSMPTDALPAGGVERYLNIFTKAIQAGTFAYEGHDLPSTWDGMPEKTQLVLPDSAPALSVTAIAVKHGPVPAVAYRIDYKGHSIVYSGDTNSESDNMITLADKADLLIYDTAIMDTHPNPVMLQLHTTPSRIGAVAAAADVDKLLLSHITPNTDGAANLAIVTRLIKEQGFMGKIRPGSRSSGYQSGLIHLRVDYWA